MQNVECVDQDGQCMKKMKMETLREPREPKMQRD